MPEDINEVMDLIEILEEKLDSLSREEDILTKEREILQARLDECKEGIVEIPSGIST